MPNVGRPSKGCKHCRERKVKCDQKRPSCSQCIRSGKQCCGYRDPLSMMFKNETAIVAKKAERRYEELALQKPGAGLEVVRRRTPEGSSPAVWMEQESSSLTPHSAASLTGYPTPESMTREIVPSIEDQAMGFFISNHVSQPTLVPRGQYEWLLETLSQPGCEDIVRSSANAASLAGLANATKSTAIQAKAHTAYGSALRMTNEALRDSKKAIKDSTLMAVIMLGLYENSMFHDKDSTQAWAKHVNGASVLLKLRGKEQFKSDTARRIFHQFYGIIMLCSLESGQCIPDGMRELYEHCNPSSNYTVHGRQWTTRLTNFLHDAINLNRDNSSTDPATLVTRALTLDRELDSIKALMPKIWQYETIPLDKSKSKSNPHSHHERIHGSFYHIYTDPWIAQMWNNLRSCRLHLYRVLQSQLQKGLASNPPLFSAQQVGAQLLAAEKVIRTTIAAICASAPQLIGMLAFPPTSTSTSSPNPRDEKYTLHPAGTYLDPSRPTCMYHLIWPLYAVGTSEYSSAEMRAWVVWVLGFVALRIGSRQGVVLAERIREL